LATTRFSALGWSFLQILKSHGGSPVFLLEPNMLGGHRLSAMGRKPPLAPSGRNGWKADIRKTEDRGRFSRMPRASRNVIQSGEVCRPDPIHISQSKDGPRVSRLR
jgi:hypothetical protein